MGSLESRLFTDRYFKLYNENQRNIKTFAIPETSVCPFKKYQLAHVTNAMRASGS